MNDKFIKLLDNEVKKTLKTIDKIINENDIVFVSFLVEVKLSDKDLKKFNLNNKVSFILKIEPENVKTTYYYDNILLDVNCYYLRPDDYHVVTTLRTLQECVIQDTHSPNIKYLERGETFNDPVKCETTTCNEMKENGTDCNVCKEK